MYNKGKIFYDWYLQWHFYDRGTIGANTILGDVRWGGAWGVDAEFVTDENCKVQKLSGVEKGGVIGCEGQDLLN
jgi:hypothetical protein